MTDKELIAMAHNVAYECDAAHRNCETCGHAGLLDLARYTIQELVTRLEKEETE